MPSLLMHPAQDQLQGWCIWLRWQMQRALVCKILCLSHTLRLITLGAGSEAA